MTISPFFTLLFVLLASCAPDCDPRSAFVPLNQPIVVSFGDAQLLCIDTRNQSLSVLGLQILDVAWAPAAQPTAFCTLWVTYDYVPFRQFADQPFNIACNQTVGSSFFQGSIGMTGNLWTYPKTISMAAVFPQDCVLGSMAWNCLPPAQSATNITLMIFARGPLL